uniref:Uncharacterized protein n=1 Tax=Tanacetum cinerariifolium TaxID=118510 RepID=A0A699HT78_TANCI|nr:hypothetical protein [Tanacetum cinerariifolium]
MTKVIKEGFNKFESSDDSVARNTSLEFFHNEFNRLNEMDDDLFTYEVEIPELTNVSCNDEVKLSDEESSYPNDENLIDENKVSKIFRIKTNVFDFETPSFVSFKEFNYLLRIDLDVLTKDIQGFKTYDEYKDEWIYEWNKDIPWLEQTPLSRFGMVRNIKRWQLKEEALLNNAIMEGTINVENEPLEETWRQWEVYENATHYQKERCNDTIYDAPVCRIKRYMMIKYSFGDDEKYVAIREDEYDDFTSTSEEACRAYQEIFRMIDEG